MKRLYIGMLVTILLCSGAAFAQCTTRPDFNAWLTCKIDERKQLANTANRAAIRANTANGTKQAEAPSTASQTTSLVDQTSASDLFNLALQLAKLNTSGNDNNNNSVTVTTSAYALYAAANQHDPLDPSYYTANRGWRRVYLTLGRDVPDTSNSSAGQDPHKTHPGTIVGFKFLIFDRRDITARGNEQAFKDIRDHMAPADSDRVKILLTLTKSITNLSQRYASLTSGEEQLVNSTIDAKLASLLNLDQATRSAVDAIRKKSQWSVVYNAELRGAQGFNEHKVTMALDWGLKSRLNLTANAGLDVQDGKSFSSDMKGGTAAAELQYRITEDPTTPQPFLLSFAGNGSWLTNTKPVYKGQAKLTIPLGQKTGVSIPLSVTYASRSDLIQESRVNGLETTDPAQYISFLCLDVALSAALLAGGADGIHSVVNAITTFFNSTADKAKA